MTHPDLEIAWMAGLAAWGGRWELLDRAAVALADNDLLKAAPYMLALVAFWHCAAPLRRAQARREIVAGIAAAGLAVLTSRLLQNFVPSTRPIWDPAYAPMFPVFFQRVIEPDFHTFPSDHIALLAPLAWTVWRLDRRLGAPGLAWLAVLAATRVFLGVHFPIDIAGALLLAALAVALVQGPLAGIVARATATLALAQRRWPAPTAAVLFFVAFQYVTLFSATRDLGGRALHLLAVLGW